MRLGKTNTCKSCFKKTRNHFRGHAESKVCKTCFLEKTHFEFHKDSRVKDGLASKCKECYKEYYRNNTETIKKTQKKWFQANLDRHCASQQKRRASKLNATPSWLTFEQEQEIKNFYWLAKDLKSFTGEKYEVDHIVPLKGKTVCGLHVPWNLQVLPEDLNRQKNSAFNGGW